MVRVRLIGGSHAKDGKSWNRNDEFRVSEQDYEALKFKFERLPDREAEPEPLDDDIETAWANTYATDTAVKIALKYDLWPSDVEGTGVNGRVLTGDVKKLIDG